MVALVAINLRVDLLTSHQSLGEVLDAIALALDVHYAKQDSIIIFYNDNT
jgi:hypothetical protein